MSTSASSKTFIVIPAYNEASIIGNVVTSIRQAGYPNIIVIDDGSTDHTYTNARQAGALTLRHRLNRGKGAATKTGIEAAKLHSARHIVTMDGDGQHNPAEITQLLKPLLANQADVTLGTRPLNDHDAMSPWYRLRNHGANLIVWGFSGLRVSDSQCGFRAYAPHALQHLNTTADRYDYETEIIREIRRHRLRYAEVPVSAVYTEYSTRKKHRQDIANGLRTLYSIMWKTLSS